MEFSKQMIQSRENAVSQHLTSMSEGQFHDVTFVVGDDEVKINGSRTNLASISPVFKAMLYGEMKEAQNNSIIRVPDCNPAAFECIIRYSHGIDPKINMENSVHVCQITEKYQISSLAPFLGGFISKIMTEENYCNIFHNVVEIYSPSLLTRCHKSMKKLDSMAILCSHAFVSCLSAEDLNILLKSKDFQVPEEDLWERCLEWADYQAQKAQNHLKSKKQKKKYDSNESQRQALCSIKQSIRFAAMSASFLVSKVYPLGVLQPLEYAAVLSDIVALGDVPRSSYSSLSRIPELVKMEQWKEKIVCGSLIDVKTISDGKWNGKWRPARVILKEKQDDSKTGTARKNSNGGSSYRIKVHFEKFTENHDDWVSLDPDHVQQHNTKSKNWIENLTQSEVRVLFVNKSSSNSDSVYKATIEEVDTRTQKLRLIRGFYGAYSSSFWKYIEDVIIV